MRTSLPPEQMTRLLLQKPVEYAEIEENARIAISVLQQDGWRVDRIGVQVAFDVTVTATPLAQPPEVAQQLADAARQLEDSALRFTALRAEVGQHRAALAKANARRWNVVWLTITACSCLDFFHLRRTAIFLGCALLCAWIAHCIRLRRTKGTA